MLKGREGPRSRTQAQGRARGRPGAQLFLSNRMNVKESPLGSRMGARVTSSWARKTLKDNPVQFFCASNEETKNQKEDGDCLESHGKAGARWGLGPVGPDAQYSFRCPTLSWSRRPRRVRVAVFIILTGSL